MRFGWGDLVLHRVAFFHLIQGVWAAALPTSSRKDNGVLLYPRGIKCFKGASKVLAIVQNWIEGRWRDALGTHWGRIGDALGTHWGRIGDAFGDALGTHWDALGRIGDALGTHWGRIGDALGTHWDALGTHWGGLESQSVWLSTRIGVALGSHEVALGVLGARSGRSRPRAAQHARKFQDATTSEICCRGDGRTPAQQASAVVVPARCTCALNLGDSWLTGGPNLHYKLAYMSRLAYSGSLRVQSAADQPEFPLRVVVCAWCKPRELGATIGALSHGICPRHFAR